MCWFLGTRGRREEAYTRLRTILREPNFAAPKALKQLAEITDFDLFVTTTFDSLLENAINAERFGGAQSTEVIGYTPNRIADLPSEREQLQRPVVYHLLGRCSASPTYVISDEDMLEFVCALQSEHLTPEKLFYELEHNHLLIIGSNFSNWLARLFLRMAKRRRLSDPRDVGEVLADDHSDGDERLMAFLQQVSARTRVYSGAVQFVDELHRRWTARRRPGEVVPIGAAVQRVLPPEREMPDKLWPKHRPGKEIKLGEGYEIELLHYEACAEKERLGKEGKDSAAARITNAMQDAEVAVFPSGRRVQWRGEPRAGYEVKASEPRVLRVLKAKEDGK